jgi:hypothetical protein
MRYMLVTYVPNEEGTYSELTEFRSQAKGKHKKNARIVLDFKKKKVIKNTINPDVGFDELVTYYKQALGDHLTPYLPK